MSTTQATCAYSFISSLSKAELCSEVALKACNFHRHYINVFRLYYCTLDSQDLLFHLISLLLFFIALISLNYVRRTYFVPFIFQTRTSLRLGGNLAEAVLIPIAYGVIPALMRIQASYKSVPIQFNTGVGMGTMFLICTLVIGVACIYIKRSDTIDFTRALTSYGFMVLTVFVYLILGVTRQLNWPEGLGMIALWVVYVSLLQLQHNENELKERSRRIKGEAAPEEYKKRGLGVLERIEARINKDAAKAALADDIYKVNIKMASREDSKVDITYLEDEEEEEASKPTQLSTLRLTHPSTSNIPVQHSSNFPTRDNHTQLQEGGLQSPNAGFVNKQDPNSSTLELPASPRKRRSILQTAVVKADPKEFKNEVKSKVRMLQENFNYTRKSVEVDVADLTHTVRRGSYSHQDLDVDKHEEVTEGAEVWDGQDASSSEEEGTEKKKEDAEDNNEKKEFKQENIEDNPLHKPETSNTNENFQPPTINHVVATKHEHPRLLELETSLLSELETTELDILDPIFSSPSSYKVSKIEMGIIETYILKNKELTNQFVRSAELNSLLYLNSHDQPLNLAPSRLYYMLTYPIRLLCMISTPPTSEAGFSKLRMLSWPIFGVPFICYVFSYGSVYNTYLGFILVSFFSISCSLLAYFAFREDVGLNDAGWRAVRLIGAVAAGSWMWWLSDLLVNFIRTYATHYNLRWELFGFGILNFLMWTPVFGSFGKIIDYTRSMPSLTPIMFSSLFIGGLCIVIQTSLDGPQKFELFAGNDTGFFLFSFTSVNFIVCLGSLIMLWVAERQYTATLGVGLTSIYFLGLSFSIAGVLFLN